VRDLEQADATSWMAFFCSCMLNIALELAMDIPAMEDIASKFFEHFVSIVDSMNTFGGTGLWNEEDGFYYDQLNSHHSRSSLRLRSMVGLIPLCAVNLLKSSKIDKLPEFKKRMNWFIVNKPELSRNISYCEKSKKDYLLAVPSRDKLRRVLHYVLDENEFLSEYGIRSLSKIYENEPYKFQEYEVKYLPGESNNSMFGGNSNWRGPIWFPINVLLIESLRKYHRYYGDNFKIECPTGSGIEMNLMEVSNELTNRLINLFVQKEDGKRPSHGENDKYTQDHWKDLILFYEYFHGDTGEGLGASHQTGWTSLVAHLIMSLSKSFGKSED